MGWLALRWRRAYGCPVPHSAVRRRPSLPRPARDRGPIDRHQQRRLVLRRIYTERPGHPQPARRSG
ncbi:hypothetical protein GTW44_03375 [Streptomyces sp. SID8360]|nr:hypothetical protein [Streptomyces sp. SID4939]MYS03159.1 hypothetical protein [Streptomyces sp. SID4940]MYT62432.1 hypothetical protein [Streptomyces sp. SID8357]MYT83772.1 hypothetical protein [Streptomyces sp. SID8360]MYU37072.1 hypothetical protein [Streptomyces sp. SID8358]MYW37851.1 hypothetical protein [Streptomyces sp. SID1]MYX76407.1 hypothetical protein [Streptomyces sp. SID3915]